MKFTHVLAIAALAVATACQQPAQNSTEAAAPAAEPTASAPAETATAPAPALPCSIVAQRNWTAQLSSGASPTLTVAGEVDLGTPGYSVSLARDPAEAAGATSTTLTLNLRAPTNPTTQVVTPHPVRYFGPARGTYSSVQITCGGAALTTIPITP